MRLLRSDQLPGWVFEVCDALDKPTTPLDHGAELSLLAAVNDALAWTRDSRSYTKQHKRSWESVIDDFSATVRRLGAESQLGRTIRVEVASAIKCLKVPEGPNSDDVKKRAEVALAALSRRASNATAVIAAWDDLVSASQDLDLPFCEWAWRRNLFLEVAAHAGRAVAALARTLAGVLDDRLVDVTSARARLREIEAPSRGGWPTLEEEAGLTESERLKLCARLIAIEPIPTRCIVCVGFDHARLAGRVNVGDSIVFYPAAKAKELVGVGDASDAEPTALIPTDAADWLPDGDDEVLAIVDLGTTNPATAAAIGSSNATAVVALVNAGLREPAWRPMMGQVLVANGWSANGFARSDRSLPPHWADPMGTRLESLGEKIGGQLPVTTPILQRVVEASHRLLAAQDDAVDPAGRLLLTVRVIEDAAGWSAGPTLNWDEFATSFDVAWAEEALRVDLFRVVSNAVDPFPVGHLLEEQEEQQLQRLRSAIIVDQPDGTFRLNLQAACEELPALAALHPVGSGQGRQLATLQRYLADGTALAGHFTERMSDHQRLLKRTVRCRNAAAHGGPLPNATVKSVLDWAKVVATSLRNVGMEALLTKASCDPRTAIAQAYSQIAETAAERRKDLVGGADVAATLFRKGKI